MHMNKIITKHMNKQKFEYFLNAVLYCLWLFDLKCNSVISKACDFIFSPIPKYLLPKKLKERYYEGQKYVNDNLYWNKKNFNLGWADYNLMTICSFYSCFLMFIIMGVVLKLKGEINTFTLLALVVTSSGICYISTYKTLYTDQYKQYFKRFVKKDAHWHKKWKIITIAFFLGAFASLLLGVITACAIVTS